jgi:hypothetical protein
MLDGLAAAPGAQKETPVGPADPTGEVDPALGD